MGKHILHNLGVLGMLRSEYMTNPIRNMNRLSEILEEYGRLGAMANYNDLKEKLEHYKKVELEWRKTDPKPVSSAEMDTSQSIVETREFVSFVEQEETPSLMDT